MEHIIHKCPFCNEACYINVVTIEGDGNFSIICSKCSYRTKSFKAEYMAVEAHNFISSSQQNKLAHLENMSMHTEQMMRTETRDSRYILAMLVGAVYQKHDESKMNPKEMAEQANRLYLEILALEK